MKEIKEKVEKIVREAVEKYSDAAFDLIGDDEESIEEAHSLLNQRSWDGDPISRSDLPRPTTREDSNLAMGMGVDCLAEVVKNLIPYLEAFDSFQELMDVAQKAVNDRLRAY